MSQCTSYVFRELLMFCPHKFQNIIKALSGMS